MNLELFIKLTKSELRQGLIQIYLMRPTLWLALACSLVVPAIGFMQNEGFMTLLVVPPVAMLLMIVIAYLSAMNNRGTREMLTYGQTYRFTEQSVFVKTHTASATFEWSLIRRATETPSAFFFYGGSSLNQHMIPKQSFQSQADAQAFRALLRRKLGDKARLRASVGE